jgi:hypothetical protein
MKHEYVSATNLRCAYQYRWIRACISYESQFTEAKHIDIGKQRRNARSSVGQNRLGLGSSAASRRTSSAGSRRRLLLGDCCFCLQINTTSYTTHLPYLSDTHIHTSLKMLAGRSFAAPARQCMRSARVQQISRPAFVSCTTTTSLHEP